MGVEENSGLADRAATYRALGEPARLAIVDSLMLGDAAPSQLQARLGMASNLLAHHLGVLERAGVVRRSRSQADQRRTYLRLSAHVADLLGQTIPRVAARVVFVCTENAARSQLAASLWSCRSDLPVTSAGTHPARQVHPRALATARRHNLPLAPMVPRRLQNVLRGGDLVVAVCDRAYEHMRSPTDWLHWSVPDPTHSVDDTAFDRVVTELGTRVDRLVPAVVPAVPRAVQ